MVLVIQSTGQGIARPIAIAWGVAAAAIAKDRGVVRKLAVATGMKPAERAAGRMPVSSRHKRQRAAAVLMLTICATIASPFLDAQAQDAGEYPVKAAFLYNFAKFVEWPPETSGGPSAPLVLGVLGDDPFGGTIDQLVAGKTANGRPLVVRRLKWGEDLRQCHILFISSSEHKRLPQILEALRGASVLTVGDMDQFGQQGGMIQFVLEQSKVRFEINIAAGEQARLKFSSKLLALAKTVRGKS
jgi:hypothetical protein